MQVRAVSTLALLALVLAAGCDSKPGADFNTPKAATRTFFAGIIYDDLPMARASVCDEQQQPLVDALQHVIHEMESARTQSKARFGDEGRKVSGGMPTDEMLHDLLRTPQSMTAGQATLILSDGTRDLRLHLRRVNAQWKIDLSASLAELGLYARDPQRTRAALDAVAACFTTIGRRLRAGEFRTAAEADQALQMSMAMAIFKQNFFPGFGG